MNQQVIFQPVFFMLLLTFLAGVLMYSRRIRAFIQQRLNPDVYRTRNLAQTLGDKPDAASDNFSNMFELPVVFYALSISLYVLQMVDSFYLVAAWSFVATRFMHHVIHVTYNRVLHRFAVYISGFLILSVMVLRFGYQVFFS